MPKKKIESTRGYKYCKQYMKLMNGPHDDNKEKGYNDVPIDALPIEELSKMSKGKVLGIVNQMGKIQNKSDIRIMFAYGYGFSWSELLDEVEKLGFQKDSGKSRKVHFVCPGIVEDIPGKKEESLNEKAYEAIKAGRDKDIDRTVWVFAKDRDRINDLVKTNSGRGNWRMAQALLVEEMVNMYFGRADA